MKKLSVILMLFCLSLVFFGCQQKSTVPETDPDIQTTDEQYDKLLKEAQDCHKKLDDLYAENKDDFEAAAKAVLNLDGTDRLHISGSKKGEPVEAVHQNGESVLLKDLFSEPEQTAILNCLEKMGEIVPDNTTIGINKIIVDGRDTVRFEFRVKDVWVDLGLACSEQNLSATSNTYTHITGNVYKYYQGLV